MDPATYELHHAYVSSRPICPVRLRMCGCVPLRVYPGLLERVATAHILLGFTQSQPEYIKARISVSVSVSLFSAGFASSPTSVLFASKWPDISPSLSQTFRPVGS